MPPRYDHSRHSASAEVGRGGSQVLRDVGQDVAMTSRTYRVTEIVGTSPDGVEQAIRNGIARASESIRHLDWFEVTEIRGHIQEGQIDHIQVGMKVGFRLEDS